MIKSKMNGKKKNGIVNFKVVVAKLHKGLVLLGKLRNGIEETTNVPEDVKEGHFAVIAVDNDEHKRFVVPLSYLTHPSFLRLLEEAAEEYGFDHEGALTVPCRPSEFERILMAERQAEEARGSSRVEGNFRDSHTGPQVQW